MAEINSRAFINLFIFLLVTSSRNSFEMTIVTFRKLAIISKQFVESFFKQILDIPCRNYVKFKKQKQSYT
jgi:hypothetical protein